MNLMDLYLFYYTHFLEFFRCIANICITHLQYLTFYLLTNYLRLLY